MSTFSVHSITKIGENKNNEGEKQFNQNDDIQTSSFIEGLITCMYSFQENVFKKVKYS